MATAFNPLKGASILVLMFVATSAFAQRPLEVIANVNMPFPRTIGELEADALNYSFTVINHTDADLDIFFLIDIYSDNGFTATMDRGYRPMEAFNLAAEETTMLNSLMIQDLNTGLTSDQIMYDGIDVTQLASGAIPEGNYQICVNAFDYDTGQELSVGCSMSFYIGSGNTSRIITPFEGEIIPEQEIPTFNISWEAPLGSALQNTGLGYILKMVDLTENEFWDIEELFTNAGTPVLIEEETMMNSYFYNIQGDDPDLIPGHEYAVRVQVNDGMGSQSFDNGGYSEIRRFLYGSGGDLTSGGDTDDDEELPQDCGGRCNPPAPGNIVPVTSLTAADPLRIGHFELYDHELTVSGDRWSGTAEVRLEFLNNLKLNAVVQNAKINSQGIIFEGSVRIAKDQIENLSQFADYLNFNAGAAGDLASNYMPASINEPLSQTLQTTRNIVALAGGPAVGLPFGFDQDLAGNKATLGITDMMLTPTGAKAKIVVGAKLALFEGENTFMMAADSVCVHPQGFGGEYQIGLAEDLVLPNAAPNGFDFSFLGSSSSSDSYCNFAMGCDGVESISLAGRIKLPRNIMLPLDNEGVVVSGDAKVQADFSFSLNINQDAEQDEGQQENTESSSNHVNWMAGLNITPFEIKGLEGWQFRVTNATLDMSDLANPAAIVFPPNYDNTDNDFRGFHIKSASITPPRDLLLDSTSVEVSDLIIAEHLSCKLLVTDILDMESGQIGGWYFGIDTFSLEIASGELIDGKLTGPISMPITGEQDTLKYTAVISDAEGDEDAFEYLFNVRLDTDVSFPFLVADATISEDSYLEVGFVTGNDQPPFVNAHLHGILDIDTEAAYPEDLPSLPAGISLPGLEFQLAFGTQEGFVEGENYVAFASPQKKIGGFMVGLDNFDVGISASGERVGVDFDVQVSLVKGALDLSANASFSIMSNFETLEEVQGITDGGLSGVTSAIKKLRISGVDFDSIGVAVERGSFSFDGTIMWCDEEQDGLRNKGIRGDVNVALPIGGVNGSLTAIFGTVGEVPDVAEGEEINYSETYFNYWYVSGMIGLGSGVSLGGAVALYGLGGGVGHNIIQTESPTVINGEIVGDAVFTPRYNTFRIEFTGMIGTYPDPQAFNADVTFIAQFVNGGLDMLGIEGTGYLMTPIADRSDPSVIMDLGIYFYTQTPERDWYIDGHLIVGLNIKDKLVGTMTPSVVPNQMISANFYVSRDSWFFHAGSPEYDYNDEIEPRGSAAFILGENARIDLKAYLMVGDNVPTALPPLPPEMEEMLSGPEEVSGTTSAASADNNLASADHGSGQGIANGAMGRLHISSLETKIYFSLTVLLGYDINITKRSSFCSNNGNEQIGANGWYAEGQAYAGLDGLLGVRVPMMGQMRNFPLLELTAAIALQMGAPNPTYFSARARVRYRVLGGLIKGSAGMQISIGERCAIIPDDPLAGLNFIESLDPAPETESIPPYARAKVNFLLPMDQDIVIPNPVYDASNEFVRMDELRYTPRATVELIRGNGNVPVVTSGINWLDDDRHYEAIVRPTSLLDAERWYKIKVSIKAWDHQRNNWLRVENEVWSQDTTVRFRTSEFPDDLYELVKYSVPLANERFYLQNQENMGSMYLTTGLPKDQIFPTRNGVLKGAVSYTLRLTNLDTQESQELPFNNYCDANTPRLEYTLPTLANQSTYALQLVRINPSYVGTIGGIDDEVVVQSTANDTMIVSRNYSSPGETVGTNEVLMYHTYFRTSKYNTLSEKIAAAELTSVEQVSTASEYGKKADVRFSIDEQFETREFRTFRPNIPYNEDLLYKARISMVDLFSNTYHRDHARPAVLDFMDTYMDDLFSTTNFKRNLPSDMEVTWNSPYARYELKNYHLQSNLAPPLSTDHLQSAGNYDRNGSLLISGTVSPSQTATSRFDSGSGSNSTLSFSTHYRVMIDRRRLLDWFNDYYTEIPQIGVKMKTLFDAAPLMMAARQRLVDAELKLEDNSGSYKICFSRNDSHLPETVNFTFPLRFLEFNVFAGPTRGGLGGMVSAPNNGNGISRTTTTQSQPTNNGSNGGVNIYRR